MSKEKTIEEYIQDALKLRKHKRGRQSSFQFAHDPKTYYTQNLTKGSLSDTELRKEYSRARSAANKRIKRLKQTEFGNMSDAVVNHPEGFRPIKDLTDRRELIREMSDVHRFLTSDYSTVYGQETLMLTNIGTMWWHGYPEELINPKTYKSVMDFLEDARSRVTASGYGSEFILELYEAHERLRLTSASLLKDMDYWAEHLNQLQSLTKEDLDAKLNRTGNARRSADNIKRLIEKGDLK